MTKTFKIGEYAVGGIIKAQVKVRRGRLMVFLSCLDWDTKEMITALEVQANMSHTDRCIEEYLSITSSYWDEKIKSWIDEAVVKVNQSLNQKP
jgi:hypothetical protein